ncbi:E3 ubiquitin-protein ligase TRIM39-like isoform X2 [Osmerus eperlanus]|uniref:E3 ubiquitin-protein ligase TRIM39-like isoform X2 n=1 Tax=Osmerus eperlanus TaxID=29151 RepID=UPI002E146562
MAPPALSEDQFRCCICLDVFTDPVSIPCGHNFCLACINGFWDVQNRSQCPLCKESFQRRPELRINRGFADIVEHFKSSLGEREADATAADVAAAERVPPGAVACDACPGGNAQAVRSCVDCRASYCQAHLEPHQRDPALREHRLGEPVSFPPRGLCRQHGLPLLLFCRVDRTPLCVRCTETEHRAHSAVPLERVSHNMRTQVERIEVEVLQMIQTRQEKVEEIQHSVEVSTRSAEREIEVRVQLLSELVSSIERSRAGMVEEIQVKQAATEKRAEGLIQDLKREISELQWRSAELEQLLHTDDPLLLLEDWSEVSVHSDLCVGTVRKAMSKLANTCQKLERELSDIELRRAQQYAVDVTLDPATAAAWLVLSADGKKVSLSQQKRQVKVWDSPLRFDSCVCVLGKQGSATGRRYWVIQVGNKTDWDVGVAMESINRKGSVLVRPDQGFWAVCRRKGGDLYACTGSPTPPCLKDRPQKVGVFVDYEEGLVSFFDVEAGAHIYSYTDCSFRGEKLHPYLNPCLHHNGRNAAPLVICDVKGAGLVQEVSTETILPLQCVL